MDAQKKAVVKPQKHIVEKMATDHYRVTRVTPPLFEIEVTLPEYRTRTDGNTDDRYVRKAVAFLKSHLKQNRDN